LIKEKDDKIADLTKSLSESERKNIEARKELEKNYLA
jgi:hypothetical protein